MPGNSSSTCKLFLNAEETKQPEKVTVTGKGLVIIIIRQVFKFNQSNFTLSYGNQLSTGVLLNPDFKEIWWI